MNDDVSALAPRLHPTDDRPLQGMTILVVEDSRFASEAIRLLSLRSGARIRRADSLTAAHRHLAIYRPSVVIADMGLPDGSGADILAELAAAPSLAPILIGMSGDPGAEAAAMAAGADEFLAKPVESLAVFQQAVLAHVPAAAAGRRLRPVSNERIAPDPVALADDLRHVADIMRAPGAGALDYVAQFLGAVAKSAQDDVLAAAARRLADVRKRGPETARDVARIADLVEARIAKVCPV